MNGNESKESASLLRRGLKALAGLGFGSPETDTPTSQAATLGAYTRDSKILDLDDPDQRQLGDYELLEQVGQGGMGVVYRATQRSLGREVAVKILSAGPWAGSDFITRFRQEAQSAARMQHPNIVTIHEIGECDGLSFFSMQYVQGNNLGRLLTAGLGPKSFAESASLIRTLADAVHYAHELNVLHLDLKPANVLIADSGHPFIADFGLARPLDHALATQTDEVSGTPSYMAPEQAQLRGPRLSRATDIYGLGAMLYELLTHRPPFLAATPAETMQMVVESAPLRPREIDKRIPLDIEAICLKCVAKDPSLRYASARELSDDLGRFVDGNPISIRKPTLLDRFAKWYRVRPLTWMSPVRVFVVILALFFSLGMTAQHFFLREQERRMHVEFAAAQIKSSADDDGREVAQRIAASMDDAWMMESDDRAGSLDHLALVLAREAQTEGARIAKLNAEYWRLQGNIDQWIDVLIERGTADHLMAAILLSMHRQDSVYVNSFLRGPRAGLPEKLRFLRGAMQVRKAFNAIRQAANEFPEDAALLHAIAQYCDAPLLESCSSQQLYALMTRIEPNNIAAWVAFAPPAYGPPSSAISGKSVVTYWIARRAEWNSHDREILARVKAAIEDVAKTLIAESRVDASDFSKLVVLKNLSEGALDLSYAAERSCALSGDAANPAQICSLLTEAISRAPLSWFESVRAARMRGDQAAADALRARGSEALRSRDRRLGEPGIPYFDDLVANGEIAASGGSVDHIESEDPIERIVR